LEDISSTFNIVIDDDIGLSNLSFLKNICLLRKNLKLYSIRKKDLERNNFYISGLSDQLQSLDNCNSVAFIFSMNPKLECSVVNARLRTKYRNSLLSVFSAGQYYSSNIPTTFINLNISKALNVFEGKFMGFSKLLIDSESPLIMLNDSLGKRGLESASLIKYLKYYLNNVKILKINETSNIESLYFLNIKNLSLKNELKANYMCLNLDDTFSLRKAFRFSKENIFWLNSHGSAFASWVKLIVPILSEFEDERVVLNTEHRPQKTYKTFDSFFDGRRLQNVLESLFEKKGADNKYSSFITEIVEAPSLFDTLYVSYSSLFFLDNSFKQVSKYPVKSNLEDFYCSTKFTKNSKVMLQSSQYLRRKSSNFY
jgi:NADH dehydrogenase/NADH:ubiquinone oxidoreductase subunit G